MINHVVQLVILDVHKSVGLCEVLFNSDHARFIDHLNVDPKNQLRYVSKLIELNGEANKSILKQDLQKASLVKKWNEIFCLHIKLVCRIEPESIVELIKHVCHEGYYPIEDCLKIIKEHNLMEAEAIFLKKLGSYSECVQVYLNVLNINFNVHQFKKEIYFF